MDTYLLFSMQFTLQFYSVNSAIQNNHLLSSKWNLKELDTREMGVFWKPWLRFSQNYQVWTGITGLLSYRISSKKKVLRKIRVTDWKSCKIMKKNSFKGKCMMFFDFEFYSIDNLMEFRVKIRNEIFRWKYE